ncbi:MAG: GTPase ObgE [Polyangiaceae bacterium]|nr:GTPase ObgE [Polyangiaceae bacterium]
MKFVDSCRIKVIAGRGGNGCVAFRREKFIPHGGPSGGDGGKGADIVFVADPGYTTLIDLALSRIVKAKHGQHGMGADCYGKGGEDLICKVPIGTQIYDEATGECLYDFTEAGQSEIVAKGGRGGRGNIHFSTSIDRAPRRAEPGELGEEFDYRLELKVMADVGLLGFPNVGKSTFIRACSRATPKVADYPFTTLTPQLGVVRLDTERAFVIADIPGLIPGASEGAGLGIQFLKHVERTRALLHLITLDFAEERDPMKDFEAIMKELRAFDKELATRPMIVALTKADLPDVQAIYPKLRERFLKKRIDLRLVSSVTGEGIKDLLRDLYNVKATGELPEVPLPPESPKPVKAPKISVEEKMPAPKKATSTVKKVAGTKSSKKSTAKKVAKKAAPKRTVKKVVKKAATKKAAPKKVAKKNAPKRPAKKNAAKVAKKSPSKKSAKKSVTKKAAKKLAPKKSGKRVVSKKARKR